MAKRIEGYTLNYKYMKGLRFPTKYSWEKDLQKLEDKYQGGTKVAFYTYPQDSSLLRRPLMGSPPLWSLRTGCFQCDIRNEGIRIGNKGTWHAQGDTWIPCTREGA